MRAVNKQIKGNVLIAYKIRFIQTIFNNNNMINNYSTIEVIFNTARFILYIQQ